MRTIVRAARAAFAAASLFAGSIAPLTARAESLTCVPARLASAAYPVLLVNVRVNGQGPFNFFVDTGATVTIVSSALARRLHLAPLPASVQGIGAGGAFSTHASRASIAVGDLRQDGVLVATFDLSQINAAVGPTDGGLGYDFLKAYRVTVDYPGHRLCLQTPG